MIDSTVDNAANATPIVAKRPIVVVLGMHRSGTSLCAHVLNVLGLDIADASNPEPSNEKGEWERKEIVWIHDEILARFHREYYSLQHDFPMPSEWWLDHNLVQLQSRIEAFLLARMRADSVFAFKDPRTARLLPMWFNIFKNLNLEPKFVICVRAPAQIARSLEQRDGLDFSIGEFRALSYQIDCFRHVKPQQFCIIDYETWFVDVTTNINVLTDFLGIPNCQERANLVTEIVLVVDHKLRHTDVTLPIARQTMAASFFKLITALRVDSERLAEVEPFVEKFDQFQVMLLPFETKHRILVGENADIAALLSQATERHTTSVLMSSRKHKRANSSLHLLEGKLVKTSLKQSETGKVVRRSSGPEGSVRPFNPDSELKQPDFRIAEALDHIAVSLSAIDHNVEAIAAQAKMQNELVVRLIQAISEKE